MAVASSGISIPRSLASDVLHRWHVSWEGATRTGGAAGQALAGAAGLVVVVDAFGLARPRTAVVDALLAAIAVSLVVNDTPQDVLAFGSFGCACLWAWERLRVAPPRP